LYYLFLQQSLDRKTCSSKWCTVTYVRQSIGWSIVLQQ